MDNVAPIVIFCYNRPDYLKKLLQTLEMNRLANKSDVYFFVDYPKRDFDKLAHKKISTWAIFWYQTIFLNKGYCLMPSKSVVLNKGFENGEHGTGNKNSIKKLSNNKISNFPKKIIISKLFDRILSLYFLKNIIINYVFYHIKKRSPFFLSKKRNVI